MSAWRRGTRTSSSGSGRSEEVVCTQPLFQMEVDGTLNGVSSTHPPDTPQPMGHPRVGGAVEQVLGRKGIGPGKLVFLWPSH